MQEKKERAAARFRVQSVRRIIRKMFEKDEGLDVLAVLFSEFSRMQMDTKIERSLLTIPHLRPRGPIVPLHASFIAKKGKKTK